MSTTTVPDVPAVSGNTEVPKPPARKNNALYNWVFTIKESEYTQIQLWNRLKCHCAKFKYSLEVGEGGYRHWQGMMNLRKKLRLSGVKKLLGRIAHLEGTRDEEAALLYCEKEETHIAGPWSFGYPREKTMKEDVTTWKEWQLKVLEIAALKPDDRTVYWIYDKKGGSGKTTVAREIVQTYGGLIIGGASARDIYCAAIDSNAEHFIINIARDHMMEGICFRAMEALKDGMFFSPKYESKSIVWNYNVHVIVFANHEPDLDGLSRDRWKIFEILPDGALRDAQKVFPGNS